MAEPDDVGSRILRTRGRSIPEYEYLAEESPSFFEAYDRVIGTAMLHGPAPEAALPMRYRELIVSTMLTMRGVSDRAVAHHYVRALRGGLTEREAIEGIQASLLPGGAPSVVKGIRALLMAKADLAAEAAGES